MNPQEKQAKNINNLIVQNFLDETVGSIFGKIWQQEIIFLAVDGVLPKITQQNSTIFKIDKKDKSENFQIFMKKILSNHRQLFGYDSKITNVWNYKTTLNEMFWTSYTLYHQYVIIKIQNQQNVYYASIQKTRQRLWMLVSDQFQFVRDNKPQHYENKQNKLKQVKIVQRYNLDYWKPILLNSSKVKCDYLAFIKFLYQKNQQQDKYDLLSSNCKDFASKVKKFIKDYVRLQENLNIPLFASDDASKIQRIKQIRQQIEKLQKQKKQLEQNLTPNQQIVLRKK